MSKKSIKRARLIRNLPTSDNLREAATKAGYSPTSQYIYRLKEHIRADLAKAGYSKEAIQEEFQRISAKCEEAGDYSNSLRGLENIAKIQNLFKEGSTVNLGIFQQLSKKDIEDIDTIIEE